MDDPRWLRLILIGLILAAIALGYFLLTGKFSASISKIGQNVPQASVLGQTVQVNGSPVPSSSPSAKPNVSPAPKSAYDRIASRTQSQTTTLPNTGFPQGLAVVFSVSAMVAGWGLRKFPH